MRPPAAAEVTTMAVQGGIARAQPLAGLRVLLVDEDVTAREVLVSALERRGAAIIAVGSSREALLAFDEVPPDVLLSELAIGGEDGFELLRRVRERDWEH